MAAINVSTEELKSLFTGDKPVLVDFWAPWCSYCRRIGPAYDKVAEQYENIAVVKVNIDEEAAFANQEKIEVIPTLVLYQKGQAVASVVAPESKAAIDAFIQEHLQK